MSDKIPESQSDDSLPMIVYLRGDEEIVDDFTLDADDAMGILGIKRSRLTQISGRDLRVGRIRRDRYIRPVYRLRDLQDYQSWTRSTASHQSSSMLVEQVIDRLSEQCSKLENVAVDIYEQQLQDAVTDMKEGFSLIIARLEGSLVEHRRRQERHTLSMELQTGKILQDMTALKTEFVGLKAHFHRDFGQIREILTAFHRDLSELTSLIKHLPTKLESGFAATQQSMQAIMDERLETLVSRWDQLAIQLIEEQRIAQASQTSALVERWSEVNGNLVTRKKQIPAARRKRQQVFHGRKLLVR